MGLKVLEMHKDPQFKIIVFFPTARMTQFYSELFSKMGLKVLEMHSRKSQSARNKMAEQFRERAGLCLFTSDVSARGMDYPDVTLVVQCNMPSDAAQYVHRLGRTGGGRAVCECCAPGREEDGSQDGRDGLPGVARLLQQQPAHAELVEERARGRGQQLVRRSPRLARAARTAGQDGRQDGPEGDAWA